MKKINIRRPKGGVQVWVRQNHVTIFRSQQQTAQNQLVANLIKYYVVTDLGQRKDGEGGKVIIFVGYSP